MRKVLLSVLVIGLALVGAVQAPPPAQALLPVDQFETQLAALVNQARAANGLAAIQVSVSISNVARNWSSTLAVRGPSGFAHNPNYFTQMPQSGLMSGAENIAYRSWSPGAAEATPALIHQQWMDSPGHRANILGTRWTHLGIGVAVKTTTCNSGSATFSCIQLYATQNFAQYQAGRGPNDPPSSGVTATVTPPFLTLTLSPDLDYDRRGEILAVDQAGKLVYYPMWAGNRLGAPKQIGTGWGPLRVFAPGDWDRDGFADIIAAKATGELLLYRGKGYGKVAAGVQIGRGWTAYRIIPSGDVTGDGAVDLLAIDAQGRLWCYPGNGRGGFQARVQMGRGWNGLDLYAAGDLNGDGRGDILMINSTGGLFAYMGRGIKGFSGAAQVGRGWTGFTLASGADLNGDGLGDIVGRNTNRQLFFYAGRGAGKFSSAVLIGQGW